MQLLQQHCANVSSRFSKRMAILPTMRVEQKAAPTLNHHYHHQQQQQRQQTECDIRSGTECVTAFQRVAWVAAQGQWGQQQQQMAVARSMEAPSTRVQQRSLVWRLREVAGIKWVGDRPGTRAKEGPPPERWALAGG